MDKTGNIYGIMNGAHYGRDPFERQERRDAVREAMMYEIDHPLVIDRDLAIEREMAIERDIRRANLLENPEHA